LNVVVNQFDSALLT